MRHRHIKNAAAPVGNTSRKCLDFSFLFCIHQIVHGNGLLAHSPLYCPGLNGFFIDGFNYKAWRGNKISREEGGQGILHLQW